MARGAAAPEGAPREPGLAAELPTLSHGAAAPTVVRRRWPGRSGLAWLLTAALVVAAGLAVALVAPWEEAGSRGPAGSAARRAPAATPTPRPTARPGPRAGLVIERVGGKPNGIALAGGDVWVSSYDRPSLTRLDAARGRARGPPPGGPWCAGSGERCALAVGGGVLDRAVLRLNPRSGRVGARIGLPVAPVALAVGEDDLWVAGADAVLHYACAGACSGASGSSRASRRSCSVAARCTSRAAGAAPPALRPGHRRERRRGADFRTPAFALAYGAGYVWASLRDDDTVIRVDPRSGKTVTTATPRQPEQLVVADGHVYVACSADHAVVAFDRTPCAAGAGLCRSGSTRTRSPRATGTSG